MITGRILKLAAAAMVAAGAAGSAGAMTNADLAGVWRNPKNTVHVRIAPCGGTVCGTIVWADARARAKAGDDLVGTQLMRQFRQEGAGAWSGRVYVPDYGGTVSGRLRAANANAVVASGCLLGRLLCKSQTWVRVY